MKRYVVFSKELALYLRQQGFKIIKVGVNDKYPQYDVYIFQDSEDLQKAIHNWR